MFDIFKKQIANGTEVHLFLTTGKEVVGIVIEISNTHVRVNTNQGEVTVFEKLLGGWEIKTPIELHPDKPKDVPDSISINRIDGMLGDFRKNLTIAKLSQKPPNFSFPSLSDKLHIKKEIKKDWDRINSQYQYYLKIKNLTQLPQLASGLSTLGEKYPKTGAFNYNAGCFISILGKHSEAIQYFEKAFAIEKLPQYVYNIAYSALEIKDYKKAHISLALYFNKTLPSSDKDAWHVFCNLTEHLQGYYTLKKIIDYVINKIKEKESKIDENYDDISLLCKSIIFFLRENKKVNEAIPIVSFLDNGNIDINRAHSLINLCLESLPQISCSEYEDAVKRLEEKVELISPSFPVHDKIPATDIFRSQGYICTYKRDRNFGFLQDSSGTRYFFHRSAIIDDVLFNRLSNLTWGEKIPVIFEMAQGPKGPIAIQISLYRTTDEMFELAVNYADDGDYPKAIAQIRRVLAVNPSYPNAKELYDEWREYARISGAPKGSNPYARARRVQLIEKDLKRAEQLFREAISRRDNVESAIKDLATLLDQQGRHKEAIEVLENNRKIVRDQHSLDNLLITIYQRAGKYDEAVELLNKKLELAVTKENRVQILWQMANSFLRKENYIKAQQIFEDVLKLRPDNITAKRNVAICLSKQGRYDEAEKNLNQILDTSPDAKAAELLEAIIQARKTGISVYFDEIITETTLSEFSSELSGFAQFFLNRCDFLGVTPSRIKGNAQDQKIYAGSEKDAKDDIGKLEDFAKQLGTKRPRERSSYYLSAARISQEVNDDPNQFYRYLCRSFASRGDAAVIENRPLDTAREWYCEALAVYDGVRNIGMDEQDAVNALVRFLYSTLGLAQIPTTPKIPSIDETLEEILSRHPHREKVFDTIAYLVLCSRYAANRILNRLYAKSTLQALALEYLTNKGISIPTSMKRFDDFVRLWNELRRKTFDEMRTVSSEFQFLTNVEITTAWLENAIERVKSIENRLFYDLDRQRTLHLKKILENALNLCKQVTFEEQERLSIQIDNNCKDLIREIEDNPTKLSIEEIKSVVKAVQKKVKQGLEKLYVSSMPQLMLRLPVESYVPDNQAIEIQIVVENKIGRSPAESLELIVQEDEDLFTVNASDIKLEESLRGGEQRILKIPLQVTSQAIESQTFSLPVYVQYRSRSEDISQTPIENFSIRLYAEKEFEKIENPYAAYAEGGVVADSEMFYGREELIQNIVESIQKSRAQSKCIVVFGQKRSGKSSILHHLKKRLEKEKDMLVVDLDMGSLLDPHSSAPFLYQILWSILRELKYAVEDRIGLGFSQLDIHFPSDSEFYANIISPLELFKDVFDRYGRKASKSEDWHNVRIVILIDEFSYIYGQIVAGQIPASFMKNWKSILQKNYFNAVLAGQDIMPKFKQRFPNEFGTTQDERVSYLKDEDARKLIDEPIRIGGRQGKSRYRERAIECILDLTAGSPFYIQILCNRLVEYMNRKHAMLVTEADIEHVKNELIRGVNALSLDKFDNLINSGDTSKDAISDEDVLSVLKTIAINSLTGPCNRSSITCITSLPVDTILDDLVKRNVIEREREQYYQIKVGLFKEWLIVNQ